MPKDWFSAFARKHDTTFSEYRATWATRATEHQEPQKTAKLAVAQTPKILGNIWATGATKPEPVAHVAQPLPKEDDSRATPKSAENCDFSRSVAHVARVAQHFDKEISSGGISPEIAICGQCAVIVKEGQEFLHIVADGFPGVIHLDCYDAWYDGNIRGRYLGS
jgi:hypothetical protein